MGKPKQIIDEKSVLLIQALYEMGKTDQQIADILHMLRQTFVKMLKYNRLSCTIKKTCADDKVELSLYQQALQGNITAQIFWLCNRQPARWKHVQKVVQEHGTLHIRHSWAKTNNNRKNHRSRAQSGGLQDAGQNRLN